MIFSLYEVTTTRGTREEKRYSLVDKHKEVDFVVSMAERDKKSECLTTIRAERVLTGLTVDNCHLLGQEVTDIINSVGECPKCGQERELTAMARHDGEPICSECGTEEGLFSHLLNHLIAKHIVGGKK